MLVENHCSPVPVTIHAEASVVDAARIMRAEGVGCLVVIERRDEIVGVLTDRDLALRVVAKDAAMRSATVRQVMSAPAIVVDGEASLDAACAVMRTRGVRRLPVVARERLVGLLSLDDVFGKLAQGLEELRWQRLEKHRPCGARSREDSAASARSGYPGPVHR